MQKIAAATANRLASRHRPSAEERQPAVAGTKDLAVGLNGERGVICSSWPDQGRATSALGKRCRSFALSCLAVTICFCPLRQTCTGVMKRGGTL
ncbi:hypothetical protein A0H81_08536 [Grifola frondosa]|uniref:Uncharacterized protein n=1 Tax=Grifola frondosa TaxID=5627 RepID=A0A1C7M3W9_GRIFR|nr:hypothetical protein A0H81_08536 [Grifola frondosa]